VALAIAATIVSALAGPANADRGRVFELNSAGQYAFLVWHFRSDTTDTAALVLMSDGTTNFAGFPGGPNGIQRQGQFLHFDVQVSDLDANGNITGGTDYLGTYAPGLGSTNYSETFDPRLRSASASGADLPSETCTYDADGFFTDCDNSTTADVDVAVTGIGPIFRRAETYHNSAFGLLFNQTIAGPHRAAVASAVIAGVTLPAEGFAFGTLAKGAQTEVFACIGPSC
jgi:hypothetical protein